MNPVLAKQLNAVLDALDEAAKEGSLPEYLEAVWVKPCDSDCEVWLDH